MGVSLHVLHAKPALGGARPEAFGICEALILTYAYTYFTLFLIGCFIYTIKNDTTKIEQKN